VFVALGACPSRLERQCRRRSAPRAARSAAHATPRVVGRARCAPAASRGARRRARERRRRVRAAAAAAEASRGDGRTTDNRHFFFSIERSLTGLQRSCPRGPAAEACLLAGAQHNSVRASQSVKCSLCVCLVFVLRGAS